MYAPWHKKYKARQRFVEDPRPVQERSAIFEHWVKPMGMYWLGGFVLRIDRECVGDFLIMRAKEVGDFSDEELEKLELVANLAESWLCSNRLAITEASPVGNLTDREAEVSKLAAWQAKEPQNPYTRAPRGLADTKRCNRRLQNHGSRR